MLIYLVVAGTTSAVNLTDGLDGLAGGLRGDRRCSPTSASRSSRPARPTSRCSRGCLVGACVGFLWFNAFPATIFMGDTGSLGLGGAIAGLAVMTKTEELLIVLGGIFVVEALSVLHPGLHASRPSASACSSWRRSTTTSRCSAWSETKIILRFWIVAAVCAAIGFTIYQQSVT